MKALWSKISKLFKNFKVGKKENFQVGKKENFKVGRDCSIK